MSKASARLKGCAIWFAWAAGFGFAAFMAGAIADPRNVEDLPQVARGDGVMAVALGDARETLSRAMMQKADSYFHGGIDREHHEEENHLLSRQREEEHEKGHAEGERHRRCHEGGPCACDECREHEADARHPFDPWRWINARIRAPQRHIHLEGEKSVELMPWLWASVKSDPHNLDAWTTAAYIAERGLRDEALVQRLFEEGRQANPQSVEIAVAKARHDYRRSKDAVAAEKAFRAAMELAREKCAGDLGKLTESEARDYRFAEMFVHRRARSGLPERARRR